jgi:hypothetical protein
MLFWALMASGRMTMRKVNGWQSLAEKPADQIIDLVALSDASSCSVTRYGISTHPATAPS